MEDGLKAGASVDRPDILEARDSTAGESSLTVRDGESG